jgi:hypothetical protein
MEGLVPALIALRNEFRPLQKPLAEPEFKPFDLSGSDGEQMVIAPLLDRSTQMVL